ncbi:MAG: SAM-dependent methyltransferase [Bacteroidales bacterium]|nr:SAM-dependent methyltransferase [Bacteroidales bacterium]
MKEKGTLYLIPSPLGDYDPSQVLPVPVLEIIHDIRKYVVEEARTVRRFLSAAGLKGHIAELEMRELNEHTDPRTIDSFLDMFTDPDGTPADVGLISEAGLPAVADPGAQLVALCHRNGIKVVPFVGPSSLMLGLMASGLNGQRFAFCGYLPAKSDERRKEIREIEKRSARLNETEIFIETPYRNDSMLTDLKEALQGGTRLCIAADITTENETILTRTVKEWSKDPSFTIGKRPCVFLILAK